MFQKQTKSYFKEREGKETEMGNSEVENFIQTLQEIIQDRKSNPSQQSYTTSLFNQGLDRVLQKVGEESVEYILASKNPDKSKIVSEASDLVYHLLVSLVANDLSLNDINKELLKRHGVQKSDENT